MKRWLILFLLVVLFCSVSVGSLDGALTKKYLCPTCDTMGYFTGTTKIDWGHLFELYRCPNKHEWWERVN